MSAPQTEPTTRARAWSFYLGLEGAGDLAPFLPARVQSFAKAEDLWRFYPLVLDEEGAVHAFPTVLDEILESRAGAGEPMRICTHNRGHLLAALVAVASEVDTVSADRVRDRFAEALHPSEAGLTELAREWAHLIDTLGERWIVRLPRAELALQLYGHVLHGTRARARQACFHELRVLLSRIEDFLRVERDKTPAGADRVAASLGQAAGLLDTGAIARAVSGLGGGAPIAPEILHRLAESRILILEFLERGDCGDAVYVEPGTVPIAITELGEVPVIEEDGLTVALERFQHHADRLADLLRGVRFAQLVLEDRYQAELHDPLLDLIDYHDADALQPLMPQILVVDEAARIQSRHLGDFANLLASGLPIRLLLFEHPLPLPEGEALPPDLADLALAFREVAVARCALARPRHLAAVWSRHLTAEVPSLCLFAVPPESCPAPLLFSETALRARVTPLVDYDPARGEQMADRFTLDGNPEPESVWAEPGLTPADAAALLPEWQARFLPLDHEIEGLSPVTDEEPARTAVPFLEILDEEGRELKAVVARDLAQICAAVRRHWRALQEQAGIHNSYARRAAEEAHRLARAELEAVLAERERAYATSLEQTRDGAVHEAMTRLAENLLAVDGEGLGELLVAPPKPVAIDQGEAEPDPAAEPEPEPEPEPEEEEEALVSEPYIDTPLCTSCDACTKLNPRMFQYNGDGQAFLADATAGTFRQLVKAAEECPARIIHPGNPRPDDETVTDELVARAARFG